MQLSIICTSDWGTDTSETIAVKLIPPAVYTVTYFAKDASNGIVPIDTNRYKKNEIVSVLGNTGSLTKTGYTFHCWNTKTDGTGMDYLPGSTFTMDTANVTLYVKWKVGQYTVTFNSMGGSSVVSQTVDFGDKVTLPADPVKPGFSFKGWFKDSAYTSAWIFTNDTVVSNVTLYAKWMSSAKTLTAFGFTNPTATGTINEAAKTVAVTVPYGTNVTALVAYLITTGASVKVGTTVQVSGTTANNFTNPVAYTITAADGSTQDYIVSCNTYNYIVTFDGQSATTPPNPATKSVPCPATTVGTLPTAPTKEGYIFGGWYTAVNGGGTEFTASTVVTTNTTVYAKWNGYTYTVNFDGQSATVPPNPAIKTVTSPATTVVILPTAPAKTRYTFNGWYTATNGGGTEFTATTVVTASITVYAKWTINKYTLTLSMSSGGSNVTGAGEVTHGVPNTITATALTGYEFTNWIVTSGSGVTISDSLNSSTTVTLTSGNANVRANFKAITVTVTFNSLGGTSVSSQTINYGAVATEPTPAPTKTSFTFDGWYDANLTTKWIFTTAITSNLTLYAKWVVMDADGNKYTTVTIGTQTWTVENLKTTRYKNGSQIPGITNNSDWSTATTPGYCWYNNDSWQNPYGILYNWYAVNTGMLAPDGWHVASDADYATLSTYLGGDAVAGSKLKEADTIHWLSPNTGATNESGFIGLPGGSRTGDDGSFTMIGERGYWWTSTENIGDTTLAHHRYLYYNKPWFDYSISNKTFGKSLRLVKNP